MKFKWPLLFLLCLATANAQTYRWVDSQGRVTYSDQPPPASAKSQKKSLAGEEGSGSGLTYGLSEAVKSHPVTLYTSSGCAPCDDGRKFLQQRGIPFSERLVSSDEDAKAMKQAVGSNRLPLLQVGRNNYTGFDDGAWGMALTAAGYPETSQLPPGYRNPPPQQVAPPSPPPLPPQPEAPSKPADAPPPAQGTSIPGFRF